MFPHKKRQCDMTRYNTVLCNVSCSQIRVGRRGESIQHPGRPPGIPCGAIPAGCRPKVRQGELSPAEMTHTDPGDVGVVCRPAGHPASPAGRSRQETGRRFARGELSGRHDPHRPGRCGGVLGHRVSSVARRRNKCPYVCSGRGPGQNISRPPCATMSPGEEQSAPRKA